jgi:hypothetical protein
MILIFNRNTLLGLDGIKILSEGFANIPRNLETFEINLG